MTNEQFYRAVEINERMEILNEMLNILSLSPHKLGYVYGSHGEYSCNRNIRIDYISKILCKHDMQIREEIKEEINRLKKDIEEL